MSIEVWNMLGTWMGPVVTALGFLFVWRQLGRERVALETQTGWQVYELSLNILNIFVEHPDLRPYFYDNKPMPTEEPDRSRVLAMVEVICDHLENIVLSRHAIDAETSTVWEQYMRGLYGKSPAMQDFLRLDREGYRYSPTFIALASGAAAG